MKYSTMILVFLLSGCNTEDKGVDSSGACPDCDDTGEPPYPDGDGDGYAENEDCDDTDAFVNPGVEEVCDGVDNDCDTAIDEEVTTTYYLDEDGDGFGDAAQDTQLCESFGGYVAVAGDCDDADDTIFPMAVEQCDGIDNDCDDAVDEDLLLELYADEDGDGYGDPGSTGEACAPTETLVEDASDCDDADADVHPGAVELCDDDIDQDCDLLDLTCSRYEGEIGAGTGDAQLMGEAGEYAGSRVRPAGDVNSDGFDDVLVDLYGYGPSAADFSGGVALVHGPILGELVVEDVASSLLYGASASDYAGWGLARGEDLDGDGTPDLVISAYGYATSDGLTGGAFVVYGPPAAGASALSGADGQILSNDTRLSNLGYELSSSPDLDGDGIGDVVLGSYGSSADSYRGAAWVISGPVSGAVTLDEAITITGNHAVDLAGNGLDGVGDVNGDGAPDLVVGAHGDDTAGDAAGAASVFYGPLSGDLDMDDADRTLLGATSDDEFSRNGVNGRGDVDGDGVDDILIGAMFSSPAGTYSGGAWLFLGDAAASGTMSATEAEATMQGGSANQFFGRSVDIAGDVDADGRADLIVGGQGDDTAATDAGAVSLFYGPVSGTLSWGSEDARFVGEVAGDGLGISVAGAGDTNGDGRADLLLGAWFNDDNGTSAGSAYLFTSSD